MPEPDDRLREALERAAHPATPDGVMARVAARRARRRTVRRVQLAAAPVLAIALIAGLLTATGGDDDSQRRSVAAGPGNEAVTTTAELTTTTRAADETATTAESRGGSAAKAPRTTTTLGPYTGRRGGIVITSDRASDGKLRLYVMAPDGTDPLPVTDVEEIGPPYSFQGDWLPGGTELVYAQPLSYDFRPRSAIYRVRADGTGRRKLLELATDAVFPSPDGKLLAYVRNDVPYPSGSQGPLTIVGMDGLERTRFVMVNPVDEQPGWPSWSPDSREVAFVQANNGLVIGDVATGLTRRVSTGDFHASQPAWSREGDRLVLVASDPAAGAPRSGLYVLELATGVMTQLTNERNDRSPAWSPDGRRVVFASGFQQPPPSAIVPQGPVNRFDLFVVDVRSRTRTQLTNRSGFNEFPAWA